MVSIEEFIRAVFSTLRCSFSASNALSEPMSAKMSTILSRIATFPLGSFAIAAASNLLVATPFRDAVAASRTAFDPSPA